MMESSTCSHAINAKGLCGQVNNPQDMDTLVAKLNDEKCFDVERFGSAILDKCSGNFMLYNKNKPIYLKNGMKRLAKLFGLKEIPIRTITRDLPDAFIEQFCHDPEDLIIKGEINLFKQVVNSRTAENSKTLGENIPPMKCHVNYVDGNYISLSLIIEGSGTK